MSATVVSLNGVSGGAGGTTTITLPLDVDNYLPGDFYLIALRSQAAPAQDWALPAEWVRVGPAALLNSQTRRGNGFFAYKPTSKPTTPTVTATLGVNTRQVGFTLLVRGGDFEGIVGSDNDSPETPNEAVLSGLTLPSTGLAVVFGAAEISAGQSHEMTTPEGFTGQTVYSSIDTTIGRTSAYCGSQSTSGAVTARIGWANTTSPSLIGVGIPDADAGGGTSEPEEPEDPGTTHEPEEPEDPGTTGVFRARTIDGKIVGLVITDENGSTAPRSLMTVHRGYRSVADMLSETPFYWAHRGGSQSYPEHSLWAYTMAAIRGFGALEISLCRTADGVWVGNHDADVTKVTKGASTRVVSEMTWAELQSLNISVGAVGAPRPFMRWDEFRDAYGDTHVIIMDPKHSGPGEMEEFWGMCEEIGKDRVIVKFFYDATFIAQEAKRRGYTTWGYLYERNMTDDASWKARAAEWDLLGMEFYASQAAWDEVRSLGKPVVGHICPNQDAVNMALKAGADGVQCSGVSLITPTIAKQA